MPYSLGIDLGTSKIAAVLSDIETGKVVACATCPTNADATVPLPRAEQDPERILRALYHCMLRLPEKHKAEVAAVGVTGQMHGVLLYGPKFNQTTRLVTWQDGRALENGFLDKLQAGANDRSVKSGYGCATLAWFAANEPSLLKQYPFAATIQDYLVHRICNLERPACDPTNAASWGFFNIVEKKWKKEKIELANVPFTLMPAIVASGEKAGTLGEEYAGLWRVPAGIPVVAAIGDNQASLYGTMNVPHEELALTIGTGAQLSAVISRFAMTERTSGETVEFRPYIQNSLLAVSASLCGGSALHWLKDSLVRFFQDFKLPAPDKDMIFARLDEMAMKQERVGLEISSSFLGERHDPSLRGSIRNIDLSNFNLGNLTCALTKSIALNLKQMMPPQFLEGRKKILGSGNGLRRMHVMQRSVEEVFGLPLELTADREEAAAGAALLARALLVPQPSA